MLTIFLFLFFAFMLLFPNIVFEGTQSGLLLWFQTVVPTLFPFFIMNALLLQTHTLSNFSQMLSPIFSPLFHTSASSSYAILAGFSCGSPVGAKIIVDLVEKGSISSTEGEYLLSFCTLTSPAFVIGFLFEQCLQKPELAYMSFFLLLLSTILSSFLFRHMYDLPKSFGSTKHTTPLQHRSISLLLEETIQETNEVILKIGGYIMLFCGILFVLKTLPIPCFVWKCILLPSLELTNGVRQICAMNLPFSLKYVLTMSLTSFGGFCAAFQTKCIIQRAGFSFQRYIKEKLVTALVTSLLSFLFMKVLLK